MIEGNMKQLSLEEIKDLKKKGELYNDGKDASVDLPDSFWEKAEVVEREVKKSVHLRLDPEVLSFFKEQGHGKGHIKRMQDILAAYVHAKQNEHGPRL